MRLKRKKHQPARLATACLGLLAALAVVQEVQGQVFLPAGTTNWTGPQNYAGQSVIVGYGNTATLNANAATVTSEGVAAGLSGAGLSGNGSINLTNGTVWMSNGNNLTLGYDPGDVGAVTVNGPGTSLQIQQHTYVIGDRGSGSLAVQHGGAASGRQLNVGHNSGSMGAVSVDGTGSALNVNLATIGLAGTGSLSVTHGGVASVASALYFGDNSGSTGTGTVDGVGSTLQVSSSNFVGWSGTATLNVANGGLATAGYNYLGLMNTSTGVANVSGAGATLQANSTNSIGYEGSGTLNLQAGGVATAPNTYVAERAGSHGTVNIDGPGASLQTTNLYVGGSNGGAGGVGQITVDHGGSILINAGGVAQIWSTGSLDLHDGTLINNGTFNNAGTLTLGPGAVLAGSGVYNGSLTIADGTTLAPGNSPGTMTFNGDQTWGSGGNLDLQLLNTTGTAGVDWDKILINGVLNLTATPADPFVINLATLSDSSTAGFLAGFDPFSSYQWLFLTASSITGFDANAFEVNTADFWNVFSNGTFGVHQDGRSLYLDYHAAFVPPPTDGTVTPEPTSLALAGCAGLGMAVGAWRRRQLQRFPTA